MRAVPRANQATSHGLQTDDADYVQTVGFGPTNDEHTVGANSRRRVGGHSLIRRLLVGAAGSAASASGRWQGLASALNRHTIEGGLSQLDSEDRRLITLAYQEGRTNREIAVMLGISVSTVARRLSAALERLDRYVHRAGAWISTIVLLGVAYTYGRFSAAVRSGSAVWSGSWQEGGTWAVAVGSVTTVAIVLIAASPDHPQTGGPASGAAPPRMGASMLGLPRILQPISDPGIVASTAPLAPPGVETTGGAGTQDDGVPQGSGSRGSHGCGGNPTSAPPPVPVGSPTYHPTGAPVTHPSAGGCG
jgi:DNA-binding Lrp family transcriptional regulator